MIHTCIRVTIIFNCLYTSFSDMNLYVMPLEVSIKDSQSFFIGDN